MTTRAQTLTTDPPRLASRPAAHARPTGPAGRWRLSGRPALYLLALGRERGTFANSVAPGVVTGSGVLLSALAVRYLPAPTHLIYLALAGVFVLQAAGIVLMRETVSRTAGALASLRPEIRLPRT